MAYQSFEKYVLRTPLLSFSAYVRLMKDGVVSDDHLKEICQEPVFREAVFLASPSLHWEIEKWLGGEGFERKRLHKMRCALLKYISRMSARCTPFGLFAGTALGKFDHQKKIETLGASRNKRHTRLDMNYLVALSQDLAAREEIRDQLLFYPNSSIYKAGHQLRYVEYNYIAGKRTHQIVAVDDSEYLTAVIERSNKGARIHQLTKTLISDEISAEDATDFIHQLIESQVLISELEPSVSGPEFQDQILRLLKRLKHTNELVEKLENIKEKLSRLDQSMGNPIEDYQQLIALVQSIGTEIDLRYLFQTDMQIGMKENSLDRSILTKVSQALLAFNKLTIPSADGHMEAFQKSFQSRYEGQEMPLAKVLDVETGIGFIQGQDSGDISPLLEGIEFPTKKESLTEVKLSPISTMLERKFLQCLEAGKSVIQLEDVDLEELEENWSDLPDTLSAIAQIVGDEGSEKIVLSSVAGSNGANLLGRFCHGDKEITHYVEEIIAMETKLNEEKILAEIVHLPEARVGNILIRPTLRKFEIPYLAKSVLPQEDQLLLDDLLVSSPDGKGIFLRSDRHNKPVMPCLTVAHNYTSSSLPIYQFLASVNSHGKRSSIGFSWPKALQAHDFLPRVEYYDVIIASASWQVNRHELEMLLLHIDDPEKLVPVARKFFKSKKIPQYVVLVEGDNELLIDTENGSSVSMLLDIVGKREHFQLKEFLHREAGLVKSGQETLSNQVILSFYNQSKLANLQK